MTMVPRPRAGQEPDNAAATEAAISAASVASWVGVRCAVDWELAELGQAVVTDCQDGLRQVTRVLRAPSAEPGRSIDLLILLGEAQQLAGRQHDALVSGRTAVKAADQSQDQARLTMALGVQADAEVCFGSRDAVQSCTYFLNAVMRPDPAGPEPDLDDLLLRTVLAGALRAVAVYHHTGCDQARTLLATLVVRTERDGWARTMLMAAGAAMDAGCTYTCEPAPTRPLPAMPGLILIPQPENADPEWLARRVPLHPAVHTCDLAAEPGGVPSSSAGGMSDADVS